MTALALHRDAPVVCAGCGQTVERKMRGQRFCSVSCRKAGSRHEGSALPEKTNIRPFSRKIVDEAPKYANDFNKLENRKNASLRARLIRNAQQAEYFGGGQWREVISPDGVRCYVTRLRGKAA
jgi:hypothetical protein